MQYMISEKFKSVQGEGVFAGTPMAFIRFVGCSVGKKVCHACDTDFEKMHGYRGGGMFDVDELIMWAHPYDHICLTGGEPLDQTGLNEIVERAVMLGRTGPSGVPFTMVHIETSGTKSLSEELRNSQHAGRVWICVSPKPGFLETSVMGANEIKVIVPGLGKEEDWPTIGDALRWADAGRTVFLQPRNAKHTVDADNLALCQDLVLQHPRLRLSTQLHKVLHVR